MDRLFIKGVGHLDIHIGRKVSQITALSYKQKKINSRFIKNLDVKSKAKKPFEDNIRECLYDLRVEKTLLNKSLKSENCKGKVLRSSSLKWSNFLHQKIP